MIMLIIWVMTGHFRRGGRLIRILSVLIVGARATTNVTVPTHLDKDLDHHNHGIVAMEAFKAITGDRVPHFKEAGADPTQEASEEIKTDDRIREGDRGVMIDLIQEDSTRIDEMVEDGKIDRRDQTRWTGGICGVDRTTTDARICGVGRTTTGGIEWTDSKIDKMIECETEEKSTEINMILVDPRKDTNSVTESSKEMAETMTADLMAVVIDLDPREMMTGISMVMKVNRGKMMSVLLRIIRVVAFRRMSPDLFAKTTIMAMATKNGVYFNACVISRFIVIVMMMRVVAVALARGTTAAATRALVQRAVATHHGKMIRALDKITTITEEDHRGMAAKMGHHAWRVMGHRGFKLEGVDPRAMRVKLTMKARINRQIKPAPTINMMTIKNLTVIRIHMVMRFEREFSTPK